MPKATSISQYSSEDVIMTRYQQYTAAATQGILANPRYDLSPHGVAVRARQHATALITLEAKHAIGEL